MTDDDRIPGMFITAAQLADSLARDGHDPSITVGSIWQDRYRPGLPAGHVRLVKITHVEKLAAGWRARIHAHHGPQPADWSHPATGAIFLDRLVIDYRRREDLTEPAH